MVVLPEEDGAADGGRSKTWAEMGSEKWRSKMVSGMLEADEDAMRM